MRHHLTTEGIRLAYDDTGGPGEPVVLLAGAGMARGLWDLSIKPALAEGGYRVIGLDHRGSGDSDAPPGPYTIADMASDTIGLIEELDLTRCRIVGLSMGGFVAEEVCWQRPDLVHAAVLLASAGPTTAYMRAKLQAEQQLLDTSGHIPPAYEHIDALTITLPPATLQDDDDTVRAWHELLAANGSDTPEAGQLGQYTAMREWLLDDARTERWQHLQPSCLVIAFEHDLQFPPSRGSQAAHAYPRGSFVEIPAVAHGNGPFVAAGAIAEAILNFFTPTT